MVNYGKQITSKAILDVFIKLKNKLVTRIQHQVLDHFSKLRGKSLYARLFSIVSRKLVGGYIYSIKLEVNSTCSLNCKMCYIDKSEDILPIDTIYQILDQIKDCNIRLEILGGEPLLREDIVDIIGYAKQEAKVPFISLYTNGINVTSHLAQKLYQAGLDAVIVSFISDKKEIHDDFTGQQGSWHKTLEGIRLLSEAGITTYTFTAIHKLNYENVNHIYNYVKYQLKIHALFYQYIPQKKDDPLIIDPEIWNKIKYWILYEKNNKHMKFVRDFYMLTGNACSGGNFVLTIKTNGTVQPCPFISNLSLGSIYKNNIWTIYKNRFRGTDLRNFKSVPEECKKCTYQTVCGGGCKAGNDMLFGEYKTKDHRCLGPYTTPLNKEEVIEKLPTFF